MTAPRARVAEDENASAARTAQPLAIRPMTQGTSGIGRRLTRPHSRAEAEETYVAARDAWTAAMRAAASGRPADLASLAITQEAYEDATAERERWISGEHVAIRIETAGSRRSVDAVVGQELAWRRVREAETNAPGVLGRLVTRFRGR